jgi:formate/nitrite transporter
MSQSCIDPTVEAIANAGVGKTKQSFGVNLLTGWNAGVWIALGGMLATIVSTKVAATWSNFLFAAVFPIGLIGIIFMGGADLFTGDCMITPFAKMTKKVNSSDLFRNWILAFGGNFIGSICWAWIVAISLIYGNSISAAAAAKAIAVAEGKVIIAEGASYGGWFTTMVFKGIICNFLVNFAIYQAFKSNDNLMAKIFNIWFPIMAFVAVGSEHLIANMFFIPVAIFSGADITWSAAIWNNFVPVLLGNMVGGYLFMGLNYWFSTGCNTVEDPAGTKTTDFVRLGRALKQIPLLVVGFIVLAGVYLIVPYIIAITLELGAADPVDGYARIAFYPEMTSPDMVTAYVIPIAIIAYIIGISIVLRPLLRKIKLPL